MTNIQDHNSLQPARTCTNCAAFNAAPVNDEPECWNLLPIEGCSIKVCSEHKTHQEDAAETVFINVNRDVIKAHICALVSADEESERLMEKLRIRFT